MSSLQQWNIFELRPLISNFNCKLSTISHYDARKQLLCLVSKDNDIVLHYTNDGGQEVLKLISWFRRKHLVIHDVCFDPSGTWLLVLCFDNTLHIVPALAVVDRTAEVLNSSVPKQPFSTTEVISYIIPFVGPHECPNSKKCPNNNPVNSSELKNVKGKKLKDEGELKPSSLEEKHEEQDKELRQLNQNMESLVIDVERNRRREEHERDINMDEFSQDLPESMLTSNTPANQCDDIVANNQVMTSPFLASTTCPYPLSVVWWQTMEGVNRAVIGYSDGSICFVGLSPHCPFVASTDIENGSVVKLVICKDHTFESVMLLITSSLKQQYKLLLEQKVIKYTYPGDISPSTSQVRESDWQIVMPLKTNSNSSDPASESSLVDEEVFVKNDEVPTASNVKLSPPNAPAGYICTSQLPPPPPYSVAINRHIDSAPITSVAGSSSGVRFQQQPLSDLDVRPGILPAARARLASLKSLGSKKLNAIKLRLSDQRQKLEEYIPDNTPNCFAIMDSPSLTPEILGNSKGSFYNIQNLRNTYLLSALHSQSNSLTVHSIYISLKPLFFYKLPEHCIDILISSHILYSIQYVDIKERDQQTVDTNTEKENRDTDVEKEEKYTAHKQPETIAELSDDDDKLIPDASGENSVDTSATTSGQSCSSSSSPSNCINAVGIISSAMASGGEDKFNSASQLALFRFEHETVLNLYQMATYSFNEPTEVITKEEKLRAFECKEIRSPMNYVQFYECTEEKSDYSLRQIEIMQNEFPKLNYDPCYVVTNKNVYYIQLKKEPFAVFLDAALEGDWIKCREFCNIFDLNYETCIEFAGDILLRRKKVTQALLTYNNARIKPIRTALKLAMFGQTCALMHLCAMALKLTYVLKSKYFCHSIINSIMTDVTYRHSEDVRIILPPSLPLSSVIINEGMPRSDYVYGVDESMSSLQMSPSSQFHLANLLLITLAEKAVNDKNYVPLWNFLIINSKYHTNMTSVVLCQSGLYSSALLLAKSRGACIDIFLALTSVVGQEFGWYTELNVCLYNLSEEMFAESITYLPQASIDYFIFIQEKLDLLRHCVLKRLEQQLNPFSSVLRPIVSHTSSVNIEHANYNDNNAHIFDFCKNLIETYLAVLIHMESQRSNRENIVNALTTFRITYEDNQFAIETSRFKPISAGCAHCACVVDGIAYFWGSNGVPCNFTANKSSDPPEPPHAVKSLDLLAQLNLEVHTVKCGRQHTLVLTNNGLYAMGNNNLFQLGIGKHMLMALQPTLVTFFDGKNITTLEVGQYHNAAVADGLLYMWGWGVYGQLGHGDTESVEVPKLVAFFKHKKVVQVSLGHAHSLVLCQGQDAVTELYVFGSNHFGQLGITTGEPYDDKCTANPVKCVTPQKLDVSSVKLRLIHTKFFTNLAVDENECLYTWGSSPQALRLANQIKRRAIAKQKIEEHQRREMSKRFESALSDMSLPDVAGDEASNSRAPTEMERVPGDALQPASASNHITMIPSPKEKSPDKSAQTQGYIEVELVRGTASVANVATAVISDNEEDLVEIRKPLEPVPSQTLQQEPTEVLEDKKIEFAQQKQASIEADPCEHLTPHLVDTSEVAGRILQVSSGLFHFALISSSCTLYTWGKNLEHQLGTGDKDRRAILKPSPVDTIERPMYIDCGADFTLVMTTDYIVKAFGGNSNGQCGRDIGPALDKAKQRVVCLPTTKRLMRFESQCVDLPVEINLPRPRIRLDTEPVRYLKSIPRYQRAFVQECAVDFGDINFEHPSESQQYKSTTQADSSDNMVTGQDSDDLVSSLENLSNNDVSSLNPISIAAAESVMSDTAGWHNESPDEQSYAPLTTTDNVDHSGATTPKAENMAMETQPQAIESGTSTTADDDSDVQELRHYIHYCLYVFHGLYNPDKVRDCSKQRLEYRIRTLLLNFKFVDAFMLCLEDCNTALKSLKIFEYFSKDTGFVPIRRQDLKFLIYHLLLHFMAHKFEMLECERFFLADLDFYLLELAYVLYFNNNNTVLEQNLNQKFKSLIAQEDSNNQNDQEHKLEDTDMIFDSLSVKFKTIVCQRLLKHCNK